MQKPDTNERLTIILPSAMADAMKEKVAAGEYGSESDLVCEALVPFLTLDPIDPIAFEEWMATEGVRIYDEMQANPSLGKTETEAFEFLNQHQEFRKAS